MEVLEILPPFFYKNADNNYHVNGFSYGYLDSMVG